MVKHRESLVCKTLPNALKPVLDQVVGMVNYIKSRPLKTRLFKQLCSAMEAQHEVLLLHTEVRWLNRGKVLNRVLELKCELLAFFQPEGAATDKFAIYLENNIWLAKLGYLTDIFKYLNNINTSVQGKFENILSCTDKLSGFQKKISLWKNRILEKGTLDVFSSISANIEEMRSVIIEHLTLLEEKIDHYFPSLNTDNYDWIRNPFISINMSKYELSLQEE
uniref:Zinc finger BED domain-containing protein 5-like n=1 Tax=Diabrotica virgifera virgifera TaxID=50390 RepID=A0A6P7FDM9_DIAVI